MKPAKFFHIPLGLTARITILIESLIIAIVLVTGLSSASREKMTLENELRKRGGALASEISHFILRAVISRDLPALRRFVNQSMNQEYVSYVILLDQNGRVMMHSDLAEVGKIYSDNLTIRALESKRPGYTDTHTSATEELHCDMFTPIETAGVRLGTLRLGYSHLAVKHEMDAARKQILIIGVITSFAGIFFAWLLATFIVSPIKELIGATEKIADGIFDIETGISRKDEIGELAASFSRMASDLKNSTVSKEYFDNIIKNMNEALFVIDNDETIRMVNRSAAKLLGCSEEELTGRRVDEVLPWKKVKPGDIESDQDDSISLKKVNYRQEREISLTADDGRAVSILLSSSSLRGREGSEEERICIATDITELKKTERELVKSRKELQYLSSRLIRAQEDERKRVAIELHDELGQSLMVLKLRLRSILNGLNMEQIELEKECSESISYINLVIENVRRLSRDLRPSTLESLGLYTAIRALVEEFSRHTGMAGSFEMDGEKRVFSEEQEIMIYRVIQESLTNIARHSEADNFSVKITDDQNSVCFRIEDNGRGFDIKSYLSKDPGDRGVGLSAMYERARMVGGEIEIGHDGSRGTRIIFSVPHEPGK